MIILSASILNFNIAATMQQSDRWKLINKRRLVNVCIASSRAIYTAGCTDVYTDLRAGASASTAAKAAIREESSERLGSGHALMRCMMRIRIEVRSRIE